MIDIDFKFYLSIFWRRFPLFLLVFLSISAAAITIAYILPPVYRASGTILVEPPATDTIDSILTTAPATRLEAIRKKLMTRANLLEIASQLQVFEDRPDLSPSAQVDEMRANTKFQLTTLGDATLLRYSRTPNAVSFMISYLSGDPNTAARVADALTSKMLDLNAELRNETVKDARIFHDNIVKQIEAELDDLERQIVLFKNENADALPGSRPILMGQANGIEGKLKALEDQRQILIDERNALIAALENPAMLATTGQALSPEEQQLKTLQGQLAQTLAIKSERHPEVVLLRAQIKTLEDLIRGQASGTETSNVATPPSPSEIRLDQIATLLERMVADEEELKSELADLNVSIARTPDVEMQFSNLDRRRENLLAQYANARGARDAAIRGEAVEVLQKGERYELIQNPVAPEVPESPNRLLIAAAGILAGGGAGMGLLVLLELLNQSVRRPVELVKGLGIQPFATIPYIETRAEIIRSRLRMAASLATILIGVPAVLYAVHYQYMPLDLLLTNMLERFGLGGFAATLS